MKRLFLVSSLVLASSAASAGQGGLEIWECVDEERYRGLTTRFKLAFFGPGRPVYRPVFDVWGDDFGAHWYPPMKLGGRYREPDTVRFSIRPREMPQPGRATLRLADGDSISLPLRPRLLTGYREAGALWLTVDRGDQAARLLQSDEVNLVLRDRKGRVRHEEKLRLALTARELRDIYDRKTRAMIERGRDPARHCKLAEPSPAD